MLTPFHKRIRRNLLFLCGDLYITGSIVSTLTLSADLMESNNLLSGESIRMEWFTVIRNWIAEVLDDADLPPVQWLLQFHRHQEFWQLFPSLIQALNLRS